MGKSCLVLAWAAQHRQGEAMCELVAPMVPFLLGATTGHNLQFIVIVFVGAGDGVGARVAWW